LAQRKTSSSTSCGAGMKGISLLAGIVVTEDQAATLAIRGVRFLMIFAFFPATIAALVVLEYRGSLDWTARMALVGDVSYSVYLLHFPLQFVVILIARDADWLPGYANDPLFLVCFFAVLLALSILSAYHFEKPVQVWMRRTLARHDARDARPWN